MVGVEEDIQGATVESTLESFIEPIVPEIGVSEAGVLETETLGTGMLGAEVRVQAQYMNMRGPCITEGGKRAQSMNTTGEQALYTMLILAHALRDGYQCIVQRWLTLLQGVVCSAETDN
jgi:hypothetical protein